MYSSVPNKRPVRSYYFSKKSTPCALIRHYSIIMIKPCAFINFLIFFHPVRLLSPVRLLGRLEQLRWTIKLLCPLLCLCDDILNWSKQGNLEGEKIPRKCGAPFLLRLNFFCVGGSSSRLRWTITIYSTDTGLGYHITQIPTYQN